MDINWGIWIPLFISACTGGYAYLSARSANKTTLQTAVQETKVNMERTNAENAKMLFEQYELRTNGLQLQVEKMQLTIDKFQAEIETMKRTFETKEEIYREKIRRLENDLDDSQEENKKLRQENKRLKERK